MDAILNKFKILALENLKTLNPWILLAPIGFAIGISCYMLSDQVRASDSIGPCTFKFVLENLAYCILAPALIIAYLRACAESSLFFLWLTAIIATLLCREIHWDWTTRGVYVLLALLAATAFVFHDKLRPQISSSVVVNLFASAALTYFISNFLLDHDWAKFPKHFRSDIHFKKSLEEFMECFGHTTMLLMTLLTPRAAELDKEMKQEVDG